ncbi:PQQ-binding-like beta-propeller repeat protein [Streptomyces sp. NPDC006551]|uniref:serine/threonine-protein kinase n=1 Tax=Streptomyces sp. NPDC006551 TaxID=3157178 RepID=UPI0033B782CD
MLGPLREGAPRRIGPYEVLARLGAGGMGEVFLGRASGGAAGEGLFVAVKTVRRDFAADPAFRDRFRREIKVARLVRSPYAAAPLGGDPDAEVPWLATAYVPGPSLSQAVRRSGPLPVATVRRLGAGIARALADLHTAGVLHRDLKPGNVMLSVDGPRLIDFGIARNNGATTMTATGMMVGTPSFMSPEHVAGARSVTGASDVFCLGSLLCYAATGEDPFGDGPVAAVLYRVSQAEADLTRVPEELRDVIGACLSADPASRPAPERLVELLGGEREPAWPESVREHIGEYGRELAQLVASGGPLVEVPAAPVAALGPHQLPTMPPVAPGAPAASRPKRRGLLAAVVALAVVAGGLGAYLLWPEGEKGRTPKAGPPAAGPRVAGVDHRGLADSSGVVPQNADQRPAGWKPWRGKLSAPAFGCAAGESVLVCRTTDGRYEALDTASGRKLWEADLVEDPRDDLSYIGPTGGVFIPGATARPTVHDTAVVLASRGKLQVRDARTGAVRWEGEATGAQGSGSRPLVGDGVVFAATKGPGDAGAWEDFRLTAFSLEDGTELWEKKLTNAVLPRSAIRPFEPVAFAGHQVYALTDAGLVAFDAKTGVERGQVDGDAKACEELKILGASAYCVDVPHNATAKPRLRVLDAAGLASKGSLPAPVEKLRPDVIGPKTAVTFDGGLRIHDPRDGRQLGSYPAKAAPSGLEQAWSAPLLAGNQVLYADYSALYAVPLGEDGRPGGLKAIPVPGAPGPRAERGPDLEYGLTIEGMIRSPEVLPVGGIAYVVHDTGAVASVELPE